jgi:carboxylate-amine ligase
MSFLNRCIATGTIEDATKIYWDIRLSEHFPAIEFRDTDCCLAVDEAVMIVGLIRAEVQTCSEQVRHGEPLPMVRPELLRAAHWRAARYGSSGELIDVLDQCSLPAAGMVEKMLTVLRPALETEGNWEEISSLVHEILQSGNGAILQRALYLPNGRIEDVVELIVAETRRGIP